MENQKENKKILIFIPKLYHGGGAERSSLALKKLLSDQYDVKTLTIFDAKEGLEDFSFGQKVSSKLIGGLSLFSNALHLKRICKKEDFNIVISNMPRANTITMFSKIFFGNKIKTILVTRNANLYGFINKLFARLFWNESDHNVAVSFGSKKALEDLGISNTSVIFNAFDIDMILDKSNQDLEKPEHGSMFSEYTFINVGRLHEQKGQRLLVESFHEFNKKYPKTNLVILGEGTEREFLENKIKKLGLAEKVFLPGVIKNVYPYLKKADTFVLSSLWEGLPTVVIESAILGKNIISSDCISGPREILSKKDILGSNLAYPHVADGGVIVSDPRIHPDMFKKELFDSMEKYYLGEIKTNPTFFTKEVERQKLLSDWMKIL